MDLRLSAVCSRGSVGGFMSARPPYRYETDKVYYRDVHNIILLFQTHVFTCETANRLLCDEHFDDLTCIKNTYPRNIERFKARVRCIKT